MYSVNPFYIIFRNVNGYFEEINNSMYLTLVATNKSKEKILKNEELWIKIRDLIRSITKTSDDNAEKKNENKIWFRWRFTSEENDKSSKHDNVVRAVFHKHNKYYLQVFWDEYLYNLQII